VSLTSGDLTLPGTLQNVGTGGVFLATQLLIEIGEEGVLTLDPTDGEPGASVAVRVVWIRYSNHLDGPGMGLRFEGDPTAFLAAAKL
jgi:Tfp pilus assembly protein PilZ